MAKTNKANYKKGFRAAVKQLLNRESVYYVSDYVRKINKKLGTHKTANDVKTAIRRMNRNGSTHAWIMNGKVYGIVCAA